MAPIPQKNISKNEIPTSYCNNFKTYYNKVIISLTPEMQVQSISAALFLVTYMIFPPSVCVVPDSKSVTNAEFEHRITNVVVSKEPYN